MFKHPVVGGDQKRIFSKPFQAIVQPSPLCFIVFQNP
jgi:hypothetical protein